jgi:uroporphyrinogen III methyltransferase / synthase
MTPAPIVIHTGPVDRAERWVAALRAEELEVRLLPAIASTLVAIEAPERDAISALAPFSLVVVTSPRAAAALGSLRPWVAGADVAAIGPATAEACAQAGFPAKWTGGSAGRTFLEALASRLDLGGKAVLFPRGDLAQDPALTELKGRGARIAAPVVYRTMPVAHAAQAVHAAVAGAAGVTFTSPSGVRSFAASADAASSGRAARELFAATLGPATEAAAQKAGFRWRGICRRPGPQALAVLLAHALKT